MALGINCIVILIYIGLSSSEDGKNKRYSMNFMLVLDISASMSESFREEVK